MRRALCSILLAAVAVFPSSAVGLSVSYFLPFPVEAGLFSHPVSPLSIRDVGFNVGKYLGAGVSLSLYNFNGLPLEDGQGVIFGPAVGPLYSVLGSATAKLMLPLQRLRITAEGGLFGFLNLNRTLVGSAIEAALAGGTYEAVSSTVAVQEGRWGWGWVAGGSLTYTFGKIGVTVGASWYSGRSALGLGGTWSGYDADAGTWVEGQPLPETLASASLLLRGLEISIGGSFAL